MQEKKKILFLITKGNFGGAQRYVFDLATNLPKDKFEAAVACGTKDEDTLIKKLEEEKIRTIALKNSEREISAKSDFNSLLELIKLIKEEKPDVVHLNSSKIGFLGALAVFYLKIFSSGCKTKSVFTAHGWAFNEPSRSSLSKIIYYACHYLTVILADTTIAVSEKTKNDAGCFIFVKDKIRVIYNGISDFDLMSKGEARQTLAGEINSAEKIIIFSLSELHKNKGVDVALQAIALLPDKAREKIFYAVAGGGEEKENLEKLASELRISGIVRFLGFVPDAKKLISGADIFLMPSRTEAFPYAILEAGLAGAAMVATSVGGIPEVIRDMQNGILVHSRNPKEIAEAILYMLDHPEKQKEFGKEIKKTISNFFSLEKMVEETASLYK